MIAFIRLKDVPQFLVGTAISIGFLVILVPVWIDNPSLASTPTAVLLQMGFIVLISLTAASAICRWLKDKAATGHVVTDGMVIGNESPMLNSADKRDMDGADLPTTPSTLDAVVESVADLIGLAFASNRYIDLFGDQQFSEDWTLQDGLAVWYCFGSVALDVAVFGAIDSQERSRRFRNMCDKLLSKQWRMSESVLSRFNSYMAANGEAAFFAFTDCQSGSEFSIYASRCVNRIMGADLPFKGLSVDLILNGYQPKSLDPILAVDFFTVFKGAIIEAKKLIRRTTIDW